MAAQAPELRSWNTKEEISRAREEREKNNLGSQVRLKLL